MFYSYLLKLTEWLMLVISGIEFTTCFKNMPMQSTYRNVIGYYNDAIGYMNKGFDR